MTKSLLSLDTDRIKGYVFATDKLKEIRGASAILDELNRNLMPQLVGGEQIYANGGSGLFVVDSSRVEQAKVSVEKAYRTQTIAASITGAILPDYQADYFQSNFKYLSYRLRQAKNKAGLVQPLLTHPYLRFCDSCGSEYAALKDQADNSLLCYSCSAKRKKDKTIKDSIGQLIKNIAKEAKDPGKGYSLWSHLIPSLHKKDYPLQGYDRPDDFNKLAQLSSPNNYIGLIYADGDAMGQTIEAIETEAGMKQFSETVDSSIYEAVVEAIVQHLQPTSGGSKAEIKNEDGSKPWPFDILLLGGDDLVMVTRADSVLEVGLTVMEQFTRLTQSKYGQSLHLSVGIVIAHANYPFGQLLRLGEDALKFAKKAGTKRRQEGQSWIGGLLNFLVVSSANHLEFEDYYNEQLLTYAEVSDETNEHKNLYRSLRPYTANEFRNLLEALRHPHIELIPRSKLQQLRHMIFQTKTQAMVDGLTLLFHWRNQDQRAKVQEVVCNFMPESPDNMLLFPWFQIVQGQEAIYKTPLLDLVEIFDFISSSTKEINHE